MPTKSAPTHHLSFSVPAGFGVDRAKGILSNLSLLTAGREAKGHGIYIDAKSLTTAKAATDARGGRIKGALRHLSWAEIMDSSGDRVLDFPGWFSAIDVKGNQLAAASFEFFETFRLHKAEVYDRMMEMAEKTPDLFGISIEVYGYAVYVTKDGAEFGSRPENVELLYEGVPALRVTDLTFAAFVDEPAANDGLFAQLSAKFARVFGGKQKPDAATAAELAAELSEWAAANAVRDPATTVTPVNQPPSSSELSTMKIIETIKAEFGANKAQFSQAMTILGTKPDITIEALRAEMVSADLASARNEVTTLTAQVGTLTTQVTTLTTERDDWKKKYETLKASGSGHEVNLGAGGGGGGGSPENPWLPGATFNFTRQCEILASNPALAEQLKAATASAKK